MKAYLFPGQGSQHAGMGADLFDRFPELTATADSVLGYSIRTLCVDDPERRLAQTQFTQPALFVVNGLAYRQRLAESGPPDCVAGHSLGEYNALEAAGVIGFEDGLRLVVRRGELMAQAPRGAMAAIMGVSGERVTEILAGAGLRTIDVANFNAPTQTVISGLDHEIRDAQRHFDAAQAMFVALNVTGAFHSRYMQPVAQAFRATLDATRFAPPRMPVIANLDARPYPADGAADHLARQMDHPVRWVDSMHALLARGVTEFVEVGPGNVLTKLLRAIRQGWEARPVAVAGETAAPAAPRADDEPTSAQQRIDAWNRRHAVGARVTVAGYDGVQTTRSPAVLLFGHRAAIYLDDYHGYFALDDVCPEARPKETAAFR